MKRETILVIASSGGHLTQAICATSTINQDLVLVSNKNMLDGKRFKRVYTVTDTQHNPLIHCLNFFVALRVLWKEKPRAMFSTGGPICLPFALVAKLTGTRFVFLDTMSRVTELSNSGKLIQRFGLSDAFLCQWPEVAKQYNGAEYHGQAFDLGDHGHQ
jgi:UDP-N-acetylglucosamine:LPS N-acetylglucosamine transferase